ncbi:MAG: LptF/LptG family permease [Leptospiraceae bacterium]|nr:LptF/LptG family permease [Leptospiraceae bacterium]
MVSAYIQKIKAEFFPIRILDKYLFSEFFYTFIGTVVMLVGILIISQVMDNMKTFIASKESTLHIYLFLFYNLPKMATLVLPMALMFSVCFVVGQFSTNKELVAAMAAGVSFYRIVTPIFVFGGFMWIFMLLLSEVVVRPFNTLAAYEYSLIQKGVGTKTDLVYQLHIKGKEGFYYVYWYDAPTKSVRGGFNYIKLNQKNLAEYVISAQNAKYNETEKNWKLEKIEEIYFDEKMKVQSYTRYNEKIYNFPESADYFSKPRKKVEEMNLFELSAEIEVRKNKGVPFSDLEVERHAIFAVPIMCLIVVIIGAIAGAYTTKSAGVMSLGISVGVVFLYYIMYSTGKSLGENGGIPPWAAVWSTSIFFFGVSYFLYKKFNL